MAVDAAGDVYLAGWTEGNLPFTSLRQRQPGVDAFVLKLRPSTDAIIWATYLGGNGDDRALALTVDATGSVRVAGYTTSADFPTPNAAQPSAGGGSRDAFVARFDPNGALVFSTYLGGSGVDAANAIALTSSGGVWIAGETSSTNFPLLSPYQSGNRGLTDAFAVQLNAAGALVYSTYLGGTAADRATAIAVHTNGEVYVGGGTESVLFPTASAAQSVHGGGQDAFLAKFSATGSTLLYSTFLGGAEREVHGYELVNDIAVLADGSVLVAGSTCALNFPTVRPLQSVFGGGLSDAFLTHIGPSGATVLFSTYWGGSSTDEAKRIAVQPDGSVYVAGISASMDLPQLDAVQNGSQGGFYDAFLLKLTSTLDVQLLSTYYGGPGADSAAGLAVLGSDLFLAGHADAAGLFDAFVVRFHQSDYQVLVNSSAEFGVSGVGCGGGSYAGGATLAWKQGSLCAIAFVATQYSGETRYVFKNWHDGSTANPRSFTAVPGLTGLALNFAQEHRVTTLISPAGAGTVAASPAYGDLFYPAQSSVSLTPSPSAGYIFSGWSGSAAGSASPLPLNIAAPTTVVANFACAYQLSSADFPIADAATSVAVAVNTGAGCLWSAASGSSWISVSGTSFTNSATVQLSIGANASGAARSGTVTIAGQTVTVTQGGIPNVSVTLSTNPSGLSIVVSGNDCGAGAYTSTSILAWRRGVLCAISAASPQSPAAGVRYLFDHWSDGSTSNPRTIGPTGTSSYAAVFRTEFRLTTTGTVSVTPASTDGYYSAGASLSITAIVPPGYVFSGWTGDVTSSAATLVLAMSSPRSVKANFQAIPCAITLSGPSIAVGNSGVAATVRILTTPPACAWTAGSPVSWLQVYPLNGAGDTTLQYTVYPNFGTSARAASATVNSATLAVSQTAGSGTFNQRFAGLMYFNFFGRLASPQEVALQAGVLDGGRPRADLVNDFFQAAEFNLGGRFIAGLYVGLLNRDAEFGGWQFQRNALTTGIVNPGQLVANFLAAAEYKLAYGTPDDAGFVRLLYRYVLLREPSQSEVDGQAGALRAGLTRVQLAGNFLNSGEFRNGTGPRLTAFVLYACTLLRGPSLAERDRIVADLAAGVTARTVIERLLATPEFAAILN